MDDSLNKRLKVGLINHLSEYVTQHKKEFIDHVLENRTNYLTVVLEDIYQSQNASAVLRTCECLGVQNLHVIENENKYEVNKNVVRGSNKWITINRYNSKDTDNTKACIQRLRDDGYAIIAAEPDLDGIRLEELNLDRKTALMFGNELHGLSNVAINLADGKSRIPMYGFTESFNLSVTAAIFLHTLIPKLKAMDVDWHLSDDEKMETRLEWLRKSIRRSEILERAYIQSNAYL